MIQTALIISMASLGFRCITGKGMIFYFMRKWLDDKEEHAKQWVSTNNELIRLETIIENKDTPLNVRSSTEKRILVILNKMKELGPFPKYTKGILYCFKPIILCSTCMASIHTLIWYPYLIGEYNLDIIPTMLIVAFMNTILYSLIEKIQRR